MFHLFKEMVRLVEDTNLRKLWGVENYELRIKNEEWKMENGQLKMENGEWRMKIETWLPLPKGSHRQYNSLCRTLISILHYPFSIIHSPFSIPRGGIKQGVLLGFWYGYKLKDTDNYLTHGTNKQIFYKIYRKADEIDEKAIVKLLKEAVKLDKSWKKI